MTRLMGKPAFAVEFLRLYCGITIGSTASTLATNTETPVVAGVTSILVWSGLALAIDRLTLKNLYVNKIMKGEPIVIIKSGKLMEETMARAHYDLEELMTHRDRGIFDLSQVEEAIRDQRQVELFWSNLNTGR